MKQENEVQNKSESRRLAAEPRLQNSQVVEQKD